MAFLRRQAQVDSHDASLGDVDGDEVEGVGGGDELFGLLVVSVYDMDWLSRALSKYDLITICIHTF